MSRLKPSDKVLEKLKGRESFLLRQMERCRLFADAEKSEVWKSIKELISEKLKEIEELLDNHAKLTPEQRIIALEARRQQKYFMNMMGDFSSSMKSFENELVEVRKQIVDYTEKLKDAR